MKRACLFGLLLFGILTFYTSYKGSGPQIGLEIAEDKKQCPLTVVTLGAFVDDMPCTLNFELHRLATLRFLDMEPFAHIRHCKHLMMLDGAPGHRHEQDKFTAWKRNVEYLRKNDARFESVEIIYMNRSRTCVPRMFKTALGMTATPFVLLQQLDRSFTHDVSLGKVLRYMMNHPRSLRLMNWEPVQMPNHLRMGQAGIRWGFGGHGGPDFDFPATRAISYIGDHTNLASRTYFEELLFKTVDDYSRSCFWEDYWSPLIINQTLQELSDRAWFIYGLPGDFGYSHHVSGGYHGSFHVNANVIEPQVCTTLWWLQWKTGLPVLAKSCSDMGCRNSWKTWLSYWSFRWPKKKKLAFNHIHGNFYELLLMLAGPAVAICYVCRRACGPLNGLLSFVRGIRSRWAGYDLVNLPELDENTPTATFGRQQDEAL